MRTLSRAPASSQCKMSPGRTGKADEYAYEQYEIDEAGDQGAPALSEQHPLQGIHGRQHEEWSIDIGIVERGLGAAIAGEDFPAGDQPQIGQCADQRSENGDRRIGADHEAHASLGRLRHIIGDEIGGHQQEDGDDGEQQRVADRGDAYLEAGDQCKGREGDEDSQQAEGGPVKPDARKQRQRQHDEKCQLIGRRLEQDEAAGKNPDGDHDVQQPCCPRPQEGHAELTGTPLEIGSRQCADCAQ
jgi:hypothetical protein